MQCICFQLTYSWNLAYNISCAKSVESFIRRGKAVNESCQSWIWFLAQDFPVQSLGYLALCSSAAVQGLGETSLCPSLYPSIKSL